MQISMHAQKHANEQTCCRLLQPITTHFLKTWPNDITLWHHIHFMYVKTYGDSDIELLFMRIRDNILPM